MRHLLVLLIAFISFSYIMGQSSVLLKKLGYSPDTKLLIIHADDLGVAHSENRASLEALENGSVNSGSIMVPCPWFPEIAAWAKNHRDADIGLHLTLTAEWKHLKWGPVSSKEKVPGLVDDHGYFYDNVADVVKHATVAEVERELRAQIDRALTFGINPSHLDSHMGSVVNEKFFATYLKVGKDYGIPVLLGKTWLEPFPKIKSLISDKQPLIDQLIMAEPENYKTGMAEFYTKSLNTLQPGVNVLLIHAAHDDAEMQAVTIEHPDYGAAWRQADYDFFTSEACKKLLAENNIQLITWREIGKAMQGDK